MLPFFYRTIVEVKINLTEKDLTYILKLGLAGCSELLEHPELCTQVNTEWVEKHS